MPRYEAEPVGKRSICFLLAEISCRGQSCKNVGFPPVCPFGVRAWVIGARRVDYPRKHGGLCPSQILRCPSEVPTACCSESIIPIAEIGHLSIHRKNLGLGISEIQFNGESELFRFDKKSTLSRGVEHLRELLLDGTPTLVLASGDAAEENSSDGERIDAGIQGRIEPMILGSDESLGKAPRRPRAGVSDTMSPRLRRDESRGSAGRRSSEEE